MNLQTALDLLEAARPGSADLLEPEMEEALRAVESHAEMMVVVARRQSHDRTLARSVCDVPVPVDAKRRLLDRLALDARIADPSSPERAREPANEAGESVGDRGALLVTGAPVSAPAPMAVKRDSRWSRRRVMALSACLLIAALTPLAFLARPPRHVALEDLRNASPVGSDERPLVGGETAWAVPATPGWANGRIEFDAPRSLPVGRGGMGSHGATAAVSRFRVYAGARVVAEGWITAVPSAQVSDPPPQTAFASHDVRYQDGLANVAWTEGETVFVCFVRGNEATLKLLERALDVRFS